MDEEKIPTIRTFMNGSLAKWPGIIPKVVPEKNPVLEKMKETRNNIVKPTKHMKLFPYRQVARVSLRTIFWVWSALVLIGIGSAKGQLSTKQILKMRK